MCKLLVATISEYDPELHNLLLAQKEDLANERNGMAGLVVLKDNSVKIFRDYHDYDYVFDETIKLLPQAKLISLHSRTSTGGENGLLNVHYFQHGDWVFAHNGFATKFAFKGGYFDKTAIGIKCDSFQLLESLPLEQELDKDTLALFLDEANFSGAGFLMNVKNPKQNYFISMKKVYSIKKEGKFATFYTYKPEEKLNWIETENCYGVTVEKEKKKITFDLPVKEVVEGIYNITLCKKK